MNCNWSNNCLHLILNEFNYLSSQAHVFVKGKFAVDIQEAKLMPIFHSPLTFYSVYYQSHTILSNKHFFRQTCWFCNTETFSCVHVYVMLQKQCLLLENLKRFLIHFIQMKCYKRVKSFRVHCLFIGQYDTEEHITFTDVM